MFSAASGQSRLTARVGIVNSLPDSSACLAIRDSRLRKGNRVTVVVPDIPQTVMVASIDSLSKSSCSSQDDVFRGASYYRLKIPKYKAAFDGFGIIGNAAMKVVGGVARVDLNDDGSLEYFRSCTSAEGIWLTIWTGKPLIGKRIWSAYYYLGYDTEPTCKRNDTKGLHN